jgi:PilZ domain-containing protein
MKDRDSTSTADQRRTDRRALEAEVTLRLETSVLAGQSDNISRAGILLYSDQPLRVSIEVKEPGGPRTYKGRLIRLQRISDESTGLAVEFDPE